MLKNTFLKTIFEKRFSTLFWAIAITGFSVMILSLFPIFRDTFGEALKNVPDGLQKLMGEASSYQTVEGYIDTILFSRIVFLTLIMGIVMATGLMSGEESDGRLQTLLAQPVSRTKVYWQKFAAMGVVLLLAMMGLVVGVIVGTLRVGELGSINFTRFFSAILAIWLLTMVFSSLAFWIGGALGRKGIAGLVAGFLAFSLYLINSLAGTATSLQTINNFSPFKYFNTPGILQYGVNGNHLIILATSAMLLAFFGWIFFRRRDVYQR